MAQTNDLPEALATDISYVINGITYKFARLKAKELGLIFQKNREKQVQLISAGMGDELKTIEGVASMMSMILAGKGMTSQMNLLDDPDEVAYALYLSARRINPNATEDEYADLVDMTNLRELRTLADALCTGGKIPTEKNDPPAESPTPGAEQ